MLRPYYDIATTDTATLERDIAELRQVYTTMTIVQRIDDASSAAERTEAAGYVAEDHAMIEDWPPSIGRAIVEAALSPDYTRGGMEFDRTMIGECIAVMRYELARRRVSAGGVWVDPDQRLW